MANDTEGAAFMDRTGEAIGLLRAALAAEREKAGRLEEISQDYVRVMTERDMYRAEAAEVKRERDRLIERWPSDCDQPEKIVFAREAGVWVSWNVPGTHPTRAAAVRAAAGLDAGEATP